MDKIINFAYAKARNGLYKEYSKERMERQFDAGGSFSSDCKAKITKITKKRKAKMLAKGDERR